MNLSIKQAYQAMYLFLDKQWYRNQEDDLGWLLGVLWDPAFWSDWEISVKKVVADMNQRKNVRLSSKQTFQAMYFFLKEIFRLTAAGGYIGHLLSLFDFERGEPIDSELKHDWFECVEKVSKGKVPEEYLGY